MIQQKLADSLNWTLLHVLIVIYEEGSISAAASRLNITQSAVSQNLKKLEEQLDSQLVIRNTKPLKLTPIGHYCLQVAQTIFTEITSIEAMKGSNSHLLEGEIKLLVASRIHNPKYDDFLVYFKHKYPNITLDLTVKSSRDILNDIEQKNPAVGICLARHTPELLNQKLLFKQRYYLYCGYHHPLFSATDLNLDSLSKEDFIAFHSEDIGEVLFPIAVFKETHGLTGRISAYTNNLDEVVRLIYTGYGIGALPDQFIAATYLESNLRRLPPEEGVADIPVYIFWHKHRALSLIEAKFIEEIVEFDIS
ncbi:LysR family transcriptional regulator [Neptunomonas antarctica]|uniref:DNA-binding transcriptional regulator, LysR family n=1 Tax=Neptunomonas antarctica TaxID=619304 RepID=A0A1N7NVS5_9GAMM|nr:LysR family transcriptional regulator [Neptunomonas antarctica]SIT02424.1 DNA-binding transcriptional regulator, LysR family [Neptunomonas antarctica]